MVNALFFTGKGCGACREMYPTIKKLKSEGYKIEEIDVDRQSELAKKYNVQALPTIVVLQGDKEIKRFVGITQEDALRQSLRPTTPDYKIW